MKNYRKIYEQHYGKIPKGFHIHHKDFNHSNNSIDNLEALSPDDHAKKHGFLSNFIMAQAKGCDLAKNRLRTPEIREKMSKALKNCKAHKDAIQKRNTLEYRKKMADVARKTTESRKEYDVWNKGKKGLQTHSSKTKSLMSTQRAGRKWFNDGVNEYFQYQPKKEWSFGRIIRVSN